jgi:hypothetical protein
MKIVLSTGGGMQSTAICALVITGKLPPPDMAVIVDTGFERSSTFDYMDKYTGPAMAAFGVPIVRVRRADFTDNDYKSVCNIGESDETTYCLLPTYNKTPGGEKSKARGFCSSKMKTDPFQRYMRSIGVNEYITWIGFSADELRRCVVKPRVEYPLVGRLFGTSSLVMNRGDCAAEIQRMGWPIPPKSSCYICPHMRDSEWAGLPRRELEAAALIEQEITNINVGYEKYLHRSCRPLLEVDFTQDVSSEHLFKECAGHCFT